MISIIETPSHITDESKKSSICPHCQIEVTFYGFASRYCNFCRGPLPDLVSLFVNPTYRAKYHWRRLIDDNN